MVTGSDKVSMLEVHDAKMVAEVGFDLRLMEILARHRVSYISKTTNANTIAMILWDRDCRDELVDDLRGNFEQVGVAPVSIVCAIGSNIAKPGILAKAATALASENLNIVCVSQTARQTNMQFVMRREDFVPAQRVLHRQLCE
jgi:aspartate kinase